jgi:hypothetical protein
VTLLLLLLLLQTPPQAMAEGPSQVPLHHVERVRLEHAAAKAAKVGG